MRNEIERKIREIVSFKLEVDPKRVRMDSSFVGDLRASSLDIVELVLIFEEMFLIEIPDDAIDQLKTVKDAVDYIENRTESNPLRCSTCYRRFNRPSGPDCEMSASHVAPDVADGIIEEIERDLISRKALADVFQECDFEMQDQIRDTWVEIARWRIHAHMEPFVWGAALKDGRTEEG